MQNYYTPQEIAEKLKINIRTVYLWIRQGKIKAIKIGDLWRISETELNHLLGDDRRDES